MRIVVDSVYDAVVRMTGVSHSVDMDKPNDVRLVMAGRDFRVEPHPTKDIVLNFNT